MIVRSLGHDRCQLQRIALKEKKKNLWPSGFFRNCFFVAKVAIIRERGRKSMDRPEKDLAKCGHKLKIK
jgi:hypothetical protein